MMEEITIDDFINDLVTEENIDDRAILAERAKELIAGLQGQGDFYSSINSTLEHEKRVLNEKNNQLISIAYAMSRKI